jgi:uroporphyrinogen-III synthase
LRELGLRVDIEAKEFTIPGLVKAILRAITDPASVTRS